ncbi:MAG: histidine kinase [bacterium]
MTEKSLAELESELASLRQELEDRKAALPAHSVRPSQIIEIEELEEKIENKKKEIDSRK